MNKVLCCTSLSLILNATSQAANQGNFAEQSSGSIEVILVLGQLTKISGLEDVTFNYAGNTQNLTSTQNFCIGLLNPTGLFGVRARGSGDSSAHDAFALQGFDGASLSYRVFFIMNGQSTELTAGQRMDAQSLNLSPLDLISGSSNIFGCMMENAQLSLVIDEIEAMQAAPGTYTGILTITITPE